MGLFGILDSDHSRLPVGVLLKQGVSISFIPDPKDTKEAVWVSFKADTKTGYLGTLDREYSVHKGGY